MEFSAFLDTCVLVPGRARDVLLQVALSGVFRPLWSSEIFRELDYTLRKLSQERRTASEEMDDYLARLREQMENAFPDAMVTGWEQIESAIDLPVERLPTPLFTQTLDEFLLDSLDLHSATVCSAVSKVAERTGRNGPSQSPLDIADHLRRTSAPEFGAALALLLG
jgi:hypothetical protein